MADKQYLFEYEFEGETFGTELFARNEAAARLKIRAMAAAKLKGEIAAKIPASPQSLWRWLRGH